MKNTKSPEKTTLHPRNPHRFRYDFDTLIQSFPELKQFVFNNEHGSNTIDFANPEVQALNGVVYLHFIMMAR